MKDYKELQSDTALQGISAAPDADNTLVWKGLIYGPLDTPWEGGHFIVTLTFAHDYPSTPPTVKFLTQIFHPNGTTATFFLPNIAPSFTDHLFVICLQFSQFMPTAVCVWTFCRKIGPLPTQLARY